MSADGFRCDNCDAVVDDGEERRVKPVGDLDPTTWQTVCCPECGARLETVFVGNE